jgi:hypothetical protein
MRVKIKGRMSVVGGRASAQFSRPDVILRRPRSQGMPKQSFHRARPSKETAGPVLAPPSFEALARKIPARADALLARAPQDDVATSERKQTSYCAISIYCTYAR